jgi:UDP-sugar transporter A1/2/3
MQWLSCFTLVVGIMLVQQANASSASITADSGNTTTALVGLLAAFFGSCASCGAGVYVEMVLKSPESKMAGDIELSMRNIQLSIYGLFLSLVTGYVHQGAAVKARGEGWFAGFNRVVWAVVALQVLGGLLHTLGLKHADNILASYANSFSVILSSVASVVLFGLDPPAEFFVGALIVMASTYLYAINTRVDYDLLTQETARVDHKADAHPEARDDEESVAWRLL